MTGLGDKMDAEEKEESKADPGSFETERMCLVPLEMELWGREASVEDKT